MLRAKIANWFRRASAQGGRLYSTVIAPRRPAIHLLIYLFIEHLWTIHYDSGYS